MPDDAGCETPPVWSRLLSTGFLREGGGVRLRDRGNEDILLLAIASLFALKVYTARLSRVSPELRSAPAG